MAETTTYKVYLPLILKSPPPPPPATTSRYVVTTDWNTLYNEGCNQALSGESGVVVLDFGEPDYNATTGKYGTRLLGSPRPFVSVDDIWSLTAEFLQGYANASCNPTGKHIYLAVGTSNWGTKVTKAHGIAWAQLVENVHQTIIQPPSLEGMVTAAGAIDAEVDWNSATTTRAWVDGYKSTPEQPKTWRGQLTSPGHLGKEGLRDPFTFPLPRSGGKLLHRASNHRDIHAIHEELLVCK